MTTSLADIRDNIVGSVVGDWALGMARRPWVWWTGFAVQLVLILYLISK